MAQARNGIRPLIWAFAFWLVLPGAAQAAPAELRGELELGQGWRFSLGDAPGAEAAGFDDHGWQRVDLPHSWNQLGEYRLTRTAETRNQRGIGWYRQEFRVPQDWRGRRVFLQFDGVGIIADVWVNGKPVGRHEGAFSRFRFDITSLLRRDGPNLVAVRADNSKPAPGSATGHVLPIAGDFFVYGGIYRGVSLIATSPAHIDLLDHGGPGVYVSTPSVSPEQATVSVLTRLRNAAAKRQALAVVTRIEDDKGGEVALATQPARLMPAGTGTVEQTLTVAHPRLWQGRADPYRYRVVVDLKSADGTVIDRVIQPLGIRTFRMDPDKGFFLNGRSVPLHGVSRHQDRQGKGWALSPADHVEDMDLIEELGANTIRFAHYQHAEDWFELADQRGMAVWAEIPYVSAASFTGGEPSPELVGNAREQLVELIRQNYNHPSVVTWGVGNEIDSLSIGSQKPVQAKGLLQTLNALAKQEDSTRPTVFADCCEQSFYPVPKDRESILGITDLVGYNRYPGWYDGKTSDLGGALDRLHAAFPAIPMSVSEYGAGGALTQHSDDPQGGLINAFGRPHPEEFQSLLHEESWRALKARPYLWATWLWNMFDFASDFRVEGDAIDLNDKGLVTFDRKTKKDAFFFYKAQWSDAPVVHITGRRYADRAYAATDVRVYSNADRARLTVNGADLGERPCPERVCVWTGVALRPGDNAVRATASFGGVAVSDTLHWTAPDPAQGIRIDSGALVGMTTKDGARFGSDAFFDGGEAHVLNPRDVTAFLSRARSAPRVVTGTAEPALHESYREGRFSYRIPLLDGDWQITLQMFEPSATAAGERRFSVRANGKPFLGGFDPYAAAGGVLKAVERTGKVRVRNGVLVLDFVPEKGGAIVSAITVTR